MEAEGNFYPAVSLRVSSWIGLRAAAGIAYSGPTLRRARLSPRTAIPVYLSHTEPISNQAAAARVITLVCIRRAHWLL